MPIDPSIALGVKPPQILSPAEAMQQAYSLRNLQQQAQLAPLMQQSLLDQHQAQIEATRAETERRNLDNAKAAREQAEVEATAAAVKGSMEPDPATGVTHPNYEKAASALADQGFGDGAARLLDTANKMATSRVAVKEQLGKLQTASLEHRGEFALSAIRAIQQGTDPDQVRAQLLAHAAVAAGDGIISEQDGRDLLNAIQGSDPTHLASSLEQFLTPAIRQREAGIAETTAKAAYSLEPGGKRFIGPNVVAENPPVPSLESKNVFLDGHPAVVNFNSKTGEYSRNGESIAATRIKPVPPASIQIQNQVAGTSLPSWSLDASRPTKETGNQFDSTIGMTPNGVYQAAMDWINDGKFPPTGMGGTPRAQAQRSAIESKAGAIAADAGMDIPTLRAMFKANAGSMVQLQKSYDSVQSFMATADKNSDLLKPLLDKIPDVGSPWLNQPLRTIDQKALGSVPLSQFKIYVQSIQNEYARILTQPNLAGQLTDSARSEAQKLIDPNATAAQIIGSVTALRTEGDNRLVSLGDQLKRIQARMQTKAQSAPTAPDLIYDPQTKTFKKPGA